MNKIIENFLRDYYTLLDSHASVEKLHKFFDSESFEIIEGDMKIDSFKKYTSWYVQTESMFVHREHIINSIDIKEIDDSFELVIDMDFKGEKPNGEFIEVENAKIDWQLVKKNDELKIKRYVIKIDN